MSNKSHAHRRRHARTHVPAKRIPIAHVILDPNHKPDLRGEFAGVKVKWVGGKQVVHLHPEQAKFYLDQGVIAPLS